MFNRIVDQRLADKTLSDMVMLPDSVMAPDPDSNKEIPSASDQEKPTDSSPEFEARRPEASDTVDGATGAIDWEYDAEVDPELETKSKSDLPNEEETKNMDDKEFGLDFSKTSESFNIAFDLLKQVEIGIPLDLESKDDCRNGRETVAFMDCSGRYEKLKRQDSEASDDPEHPIDQSANSENAKCIESVGTSEDVR